MTRVFLTIDAEIAWRHHRAGLPLAEIERRSFDGAAVGLAYQLATLARHGLKACVFVDPMPALVYGLAPVSRVVEQVLAAGQEVQLHLHPQWAGARAGEAGAQGRFQLWEFHEAAQRDLIAGAAELLAAAGAPPPVAFRAGSYAADDATLPALAGLGIRYDSSHNGAEAGASRIGLPARQIAPVARAGVVEVPVTVIEDRPGRLRTFQPCALSASEAADALDHAAAADHAAVTIVSHSFELANRAGTRANAVHVRRFHALCDLLDRRRDMLPTTWFRDGPDLPLDRADAPLGPARLRTRWRQAEQLWSNWVEERAA
ncbi:polysaccharide deacetylase [uncultured Sphingomonas sp.]|uniref:polysaccharide deacetylase n=1 Tax=uncultured Sphingomonas sp. TaxID=158754 RepID=UPI0035CBECCA